MSYEVRVVRTIRIDTWRENLPDHDCVPGKFCCHSSADAIQATQDIHKEIQEISVLIAMDNQGRIVGIEEVGRGSAGSVAVDCPTLLRKAQLSGGDQFAMVHNHPTSSKIIPSHSDCEVFYKSVLAFHFTGLALIDSIIVGPKSMGLEKEHAFSFQLQDPNYVTNMQYIDGELERFKSGLKIFDPNVVPFTKKGKVDRDPIQTLMRLLGGQDRPNDDDDVLN